MFKGSRHWWAANRGAARKTTVSGIVLVVALVATGAAVWASPGGLTLGPTVEEQLAAALAENEQLRGDLDSANARLDRDDEKAAATPTPSASPSPTPEPSATAEPEEQTPPETVVIVRNAPEGNGSEQAVAAPPAASASSASSAATVTAPSTASIMAPTQRYFGMYTSQAPFNFATFDDAAVKAGSAQTLVGYFGGWDQAFRGDAVTRSWERGLVPMLTWESRPINAANDEPEDPEYSLPRILSGAFDEYLHQYARDIVETGLPLIIRLNHEMNGTWYPWAEQKTSGASNNGNGAGDYAAVWRYVHDIFEAEGANELVIWMWAPNIVNNLPARHQTIEYLASLYPGEEYVDLVGVSGYLRTPFVAANTFTFDYTFGSTLEQLRTLTDKPIMLAEIGATENGGKKAQWITDVFDALTRPENDDIIGIAWFNLAVTTISQGERVTNDWRIDSRQDSLTAFREGLADPAANFAVVPH